MEVAGMEEGDFTISLSNRQLLISGVRRGPEARLLYQQAEIQYGEFRAEVYLPGAVIDNEIDAVYRDGFLKVIMPKARAHRVPVIAGETATKTEEV